MKRKTAFMVAVAMTLMFQVSSGWGQSKPGETMVLQRPEEYQLKVLESQIQMLRHKLYMQQRMDKKEEAQWMQHYQAVAKRLESWNKFAGQYLTSD